MKKEKITFIQEKKLEKKAQENHELMQNKYSENPIKAKFKAFVKTKKEISIKDLFY